MAYENIFNFLNEGKHLKSDYKNAKAVHRIIQKLNDH